MRMNSTRSFQKRFDPLPGLASLAVLVLWCTGAISTLADDWPQWRGPNRDGVWAEAGVLESFPADGLKVSWRNPIGPGWSSPVVSHGRVFVTDVKLETQPAQERVHAFDETSGKPLWTYAYDAVYPDWALNAENSSPPCATPIVEADKLYTVGGNGHVHCLEAATGKLVWEKRLDKEYEIPVLSCRPSPLIEGELLIVFTGGKPGACVVALEKNSGKEIWKALGEGISNSSPIVVAAGREDGV
jgi:outer membrane protein assembly factor BamB